jgi:hypothetical protein
VNTVLFCGAEIQTETLVVGVLTVQRRCADVAEPYEVRVGRLIGKDATELGQIVERVAAAESQVRAGAVDVAV